MEHDVRPQGERALVYRRREGAVDHDDRPGLMAGLRKAFYVDQVGFGEGLPDLHTLRRLNEEAIFLGFILFTLCMIFGSIWAYVAWGYYISWNIKSVWSLVVWLFYGGMCHAKFIRRWQGGVYAGLSIAGFAIVLFTYLGIGLLLSSNHPLD